MASPRFVSIDGGASARLELMCLRVAGAVTRPLHYRGFQPIVRRVGRQFALGNSVVLRLPHGGQFRVPLHDGYWASLINPGYRYEPEVEYLLREFLHQNDVFFFDCGANMGYWSIVAASWMGGWERIVTIEASPRNFPLLEENARLNGGGGKPLLLAVWHHDGEPLKIVSHDIRHAGSSVVNRREKERLPGYYTDTVSSVTLDTLMDRYAADPSAGIAVKLDVEGAEIAALEGANRLLASRDSIWIYEDHS